MSLKTIVSKRNLSLLAFIFVVLIVGAVARSTGIRFSVKSEGFKKEATANTKASSTSISNLFSVAAN